MLPGRIRASLSGVVVLSCASLMSCSSADVDTAIKTVHAAVKKDKDRKRAPEFSLKDSNGASVRLSDYKGKVVLLNFWATWCGPCKIEIPWFMEFEQQYKNRGFAVLGVSMDDDGWESVKPYLEARKINYRVLLGTDEVSDLYGGVDSLPTTYLVDRDGKVATVHVGLVGKNTYQDDILNLLDEGTKAANAR